MVSKFSDRPAPGAMRARDCAAYLGIGTSTWWRWVQDGRVSPGIRLTPRTTVWPVEVVQGLLKDASQTQK